MIIKPKSPIVQEDYECETCHEVYAHKGACIQCEGSHSHKVKGEFVYLAEDVDHDLEITWPNSSWVSIHYVQWTKPGWYGADPNYEGEDEPHLFHVSEIKRLCLVKKKAIDKCLATIKALTA